MCVCMCVCLCVRVCAHAPSIGGEGIKWRVDSGEVDALVGRQRAQLHVFLALVHIADVEERPPST
jgi:hypothetical protein